MLKNIYHYLLIKHNRLFDKRYYLFNNPDVANADLDPLWHFVCDGWKDNRNPSANFDTEFYLSLYDDVKQLGINPLIHYIKFGIKEQRSPHPLSHREMHKKFSSQKIRNEHNKILLYLHIGQNKTGTSAIQNFLDKNRIQLFSEFGCLYPNFKAQDLISGVCSNHTVWYQEVAHDEIKLISDFNRLIEFCARFNINKLIMSNEGWFLGDEIINTSKFLLENDFPIVIKPICYIRRIDHWVESAWKQWGLKQYIDFVEFVNLPEHNHLFDRAIKHFELWTEIIDNDSIIVRPYEKQQLKFGLLHDFLSLIGIDYNQNKWKKDENGANTGFNQDVVELLHICRELFTNVHDNHLFDLFTDLLGDDFRKIPFESYQLLSPKIRGELINKNLPFEQEIARKFMGRENGRIFYQPIPDPDEPWEPYQGLTLEKAIPIIIKMIDSLHI